MHARCGGCWLGVGCWQDPVAGFAFSPNLWPSTRHITTATFRSVMEQHYTACNDLSNQLLRLFAIALDLPPDFFSSKVHCTAQQIPFPIPGPCDASTVR